MIDDHDTGPITKYAEEMEAKRMRNMRWFKSRDGEVVLYDPAEPKNGMDVYLKHLLNPENGFVECHSDGSVLK